MDQYVTGAMIRRLRVERIEDELYVTVPREMSKTHYISFLAAARQPQVACISAAAGVQSSVI